MTEIALDRTDYKIIKALEHNGRASNALIAEQVNLSQSQCLRRIKRLEECGIIRGYRAQIDYEKMGYTVVAWTLVTISKDVPEARDNVTRYLQEQEQAVSVFGVTGDVDLMVEIRAKDMAAFSDFVVKGVYAHEQVVSTKSYIRLDTAKLNGGIIT